MKRVIIVQARTGSSRLPGKVLADLAGRPMLAQQLRRLKRCTRADEIVVATTTAAADAPLIAIARAEGVRWFTGDEQDVLGRFAAAARDAGADLVARITADCPLIDPGVTDGVIDRVESGLGRVDYASNVLRRTFPRGLDAEAMAADVLYRTARLAHSPDAREHVTWFIYHERADLFLLESVEDEADNSDLRWTVDTAEDLERVRRIYAELGLADRDVPYSEILASERSRAAAAGDTR
jgi:spore coat polysaccharide biosynthesis protein SpsF